MNTCRTEQSAVLYLRCTLVRRGFLWDYEASDMEYYWNSAQSAVLKVFLSLSCVML